MKSQIEQNVLFHFLPELNECMGEMRACSDRDAICLAQLELLVDQVTKANVTTSQRLGSLLKEGHIVICKVKIFSILSDNRQPGN